MAAETDCCVCDPPSAYNYLAHFSFTRSRFGQPETGWSHSISWHYDTRGLVLRLRSTFCDASRRLPRDRLCSAFCDASQKRIGQRRLPKMNGGRLLDLGSTFCDTSKRRMVRDRLLRLRSAFCDASTSGMARDKLLRLWSAFCDALKRGMARDRPLRL